MRGSLRDIKKEREVRLALGNKIKGDNFEVCKLNLLDDIGWDNSTSNCDYLMHIASPCIVKEPKDEKEIIDPAVKGTLRALKAAHKSNVKKVILTSSIGSIVFGHNKKICDPSDWTDISSDGMVSQAAEALKLRRTTLIEKMKKLMIDKPVTKETSSD